jgi:ubiquitin carboxyl-terminal hydrolase 34
VERGEISSKDLFPAGKVFQARYAAQALQTKLREQIRNVSSSRIYNSYVLTCRQSIMDEVFLSNAIQRLEKALLDTRLMSETFSRPQEMQLAAVHVNVMLEFLRGESPGTYLWIDQFLT